MYVCLCYGLSEKRIREIVSAGACSMADVQKNCSAGTNCGTCVRHLKAVITSHTTSASAVATATKEPNEP